MPFFSLTAQDIVFAAMLAFFFTWLINRVSKLYKVLITRSTEFDYHPRNLEAVLLKCYNLFPNEIIQFNGLTIKRGMSVRVVTHQHRMIEGQFIGINNENMVCFITKQNVVAQELDKIEEINLLEG